VVVQDAALTRAAKFSEGWIGVWCSARRFADAVSIVHREAEELDRDNVAWCHGYQPWVGVDLKSSKKAYDAVKKGYGRAFITYLSKNLSAIRLLARRRKVAEQLVPYIEAGCRLFNLKICAEHAEEEVALGAEVVAQLKRLAPTVAVPT
jgi:hypothetical protein